MSGERKYNPDTLNWEYKFTVDHDDRFIHTAEPHGLSGGIVTGILDTKEAAIRAAMIDMGWTPPEESLIQTIAAAVHAAGGEIRIGMRSAVIAPSLTLTRTIDHSDGGGIILTVKVKE